MLLGSHTGSQAIEKKKSTIAFIKCFYIYLVFLESQQWSCVCSQFVHSDDEQTKYGWFPYGTFIVNLASLTMHSDPIQNLKAQNSGCSTKPGVCSLPHNYFLCRCRTVRSASSSQNKSLLVFAYNSTRVETVSPEHHQQRKSACCMVNNNASLHSCESLSSLYWVSKVWGVKLNMMSPSITQPLPALVTKPSLLLSKPLPPVGYRVELVRASIKKNEYIYFYFDKPNQ